MVKAVTKYPMTIYLPFPNGQVSRLLKELGHNVLEERSKGVPDAHLWTGGADICPLLYGEKVLPGTSVNLSRDRSDIRHYQSLSSYVPKIGICRGAQFLNVMSGGQLWQDVNNHNKGDHIILLSDDKDKKPITVSSTHHQMMIPGYDCIELANANKSTNKTAEGVNMDYNIINDWDDLEIAFYPNTNSLCFQYHPEFTRHNFGDPMIHVFNDLVDTYLGEEVYRHKTKKADKGVTTV